MKYLIAACLSIIFLSGCDRQPEEYHHSTLRFGTLIDITLYDIDEKLAEKAFQVLDADFEHYHSAWTPYEPSSLSRINSLIPTGKPFSISPAVLPLIEDSLKLAEQTNDLYNPAIGKLIKLWQFHRHDEPGMQPPDENKIRQLVEQNPRMSDLEIDGIKMLSRNPAVELNFGAYAKGYAIDLSMAYLKNMGINNAIINTGGDLKVIGKHGERPWNIAIRHPRKSSILASIKAQDNEAIFTSGDYERYFMFEGKRYHHILDPRTGYPAEGTQSVTVIHNHAALADVAATALFVAGPKDWYKIAQKLDLKMAMLMDSNGNIHVTPEMKKRLVFNDKNETTLIVSPPL